MPSGLTSLLWFIAILALIPASLWFLRRTPLGGGAAQGVLRSVAALPLSASQRIVAIEVGSGDERRWLVLGVTPSSITTLHTLLPGETVPAPASAQAPLPPTFQALFAKMKRGQADRGDGGTGAG